MVYPRNFKKLLGASRKENPIKYSEPSIVSYAPLHVFSRKLAELTSPAQQSQFIRDEYERLFLEFPPSDKHIELINTKVSYGILKNCYEGAGVRPTEEIQKNIKAAFDFDIEGFSEKVKTGLKIRLQKQEEKMVAIKKTSKPKASGTVSANSTQETVTQSYIRLFSENVKSNLTDAQLALKMSQLHPGMKAYDAQDIKAIRGMYNRGKLSGQKTKPSSPAVVVEAKK